MCVQNCDFVPFMCHLFAVYIDGIANVSNLTL